MKTFWLLAATAVADYSPSCSSSKDCGQRQTCDAGKCRRIMKCDSVTCSDNEKCREKTGTCICEEGYARHSTGICLPDPCAQGPCHRHAECSLKEKKNGDFEAVCSCKSGKRGDGVSVCVKDYCETATHRCGQNAICKPLGAEYNYDYECECEAGFTGTDSRHKDLKGSGYRSDCEEFSCEEKLVAPIDKKYEVVLPESEKGWSWTAAQQLCREKGPYWDLVVIDDEVEHQKVVGLTNCATTAFWVGINKRFAGGDFQSVLGDEIAFEKWAKSEPTNDDREMCVRMRLGKYNDANCRTPYTQKKSSGVGMGYICERHNKRPGDGMRCEQRSNDRIAAFKTARGCPAPTCLGKGNYNIVDSWKKPSNGAHLASLYGFAVSITLPDTAFDSDGGAVMLRFADGNQMGSVQTYNLRFYGFYNNNNDILFHTKELVCNIRSDKFNFTSHAGAWSL